MVSHEEVIFVPLTIYPKGWVVGSEGRIYKEFFVYQALKLFQLYTGMKSCYQHLFMLQKDNQTEENKEKIAFNFEVLWLESVPFTEKKKIMDLILLPVIFDNWK